MDKSPPRHAPMNRFPVVDGQLSPGGVPIRLLAARAGTTPFYVYDRSVMDAQVAALRQTLPDSVHLHYAIKANPMPAVVQHLARITDGLDVASLGELQVALDTGIPSDHISFAGPGKSDAELAAATAAGVIVNLESIHEMERLARAGERLGVRPVAAIRVNPDFELKASGMKMSGGPKPFGIDAEQVPQALQRIAELDIDWRGFHIFSGSQNLRAEAIIEAQRKTLELARRLAESAPAPMRWLNIGGGFGIPYFPGDTPLSLKPIGEHLQRLAADAAAWLPEARLVVELGRFLVGEAGLYVCEVIDRKVSRDKTFLVTNGGLHHHLAASGNFGQVIRKNYPVAVATAMNRPEQETVNVVGPLCTPLDILAADMTLPRAEIGDLIAIYQSGAYGLSASPQQFLSHPHIPEILV